MWLVLVTAAIGLDDIACAGPVTAGALAAGILCSPRELFSFMCGDWRTLMRRQAFEPGGGIGLPTTNDTKEFS
jgi:hypothetical protein